MRLERDVWAALRKALPPGLMVRRIEDMSGALGTPDVIIMKDGRCLWLELKFGGPDAKPQMRKGQMAFAVSAWAVGVPVYVLMGHPDGSCKLIDGRTCGDDWRELLICRFPGFTDHLVQAILEMLAHGEQHGTDLRYWRERLAGAGSQEVRG